MVAHDEVIAGERIQRVVEFRGLRNGEVARVGHAVGLTLQQ